MSKFIDERISKTFQENELDIANQKLEISQILRDKDIKIKLLEDCLAKKDEVIYLLTKKLSISNSHHPSHAKISPWLPDENLIDSNISNKPSSADEINILKDNVNTGNEIDVTESMKRNLDRQLMEIREHHKETYYRTHFHKITDLSINSPNTNSEIDT